jgi:predicted ATPase
VINHAFKEDLKARYEIVLKKHKELDLDGALYKSLIEIKATDNINYIKETIENLPTKSRVFIKENNKTIEMMPKDIGVGISQVLPIIPLAISGGWDNEGLIAIEQPELHIHPAMQVGLADVFIEGLQYDNNILFQKRFILETHSEHILLRLLRRVREPKEDTNEELKADELGVYFLEPSSDGIIATRIRVNDEGEFKDPWPRGFFNERAEELF